MYKSHVHIGHDDVTWVLESDIICDACYNCDSCTSCVACTSCDDCTACQNCQGCTGFCTSCASGCYEACFGDCYTCQDCQAGCTSCNSCTDRCDGGCQTECYACVNCDSCVGCDGDCVGCQGGCQNCTACAGCNGCTGQCTTCVGCVGETTCTTACQTSCNACVDCTGGCQESCQVCVGCTTGCQSGCQTGCQTGCTTTCQMCTGDSCNSCNNCTNYNGYCEYVPCSPCVGVVSCGSGQTPPECPSCYGPSQNIICPSCNNSGQGGQNPCNNGCFSGEYTPDEPEQPKKTWHTYCQGINNGGYKAGINNSCTGGGDDGYHSDCPSEWLEEGHTEEEWNNLDYGSQKEFATKHGYEEENHDPPSDFVSTALDDLVDNIPELEGKDIKVETSCDPKTGKITQVIRDKNTGEVLITSEQNEDGSFDYKKPDGTLVLEGVKTNGNGEITEGTGYGEDDKKTNLSDGTTTMPDPNTGKEVSVEPQGAGC